MDDNRVRIMLKIVVCDDEKVLCEQIRRLLLDLALEFPEDIEISCYTDVTGLESVVRSCDILLLDIRLQGTDGIAYAKELRRQGISCIIIFITALRECVFEAFEAEAFDYICKPVEAGRLRSAVTRAAARVRKDKERTLFVRTRDWCRAVPLGSIYYCEVIDRKLYLHTDGGTVAFYGRLGEVERELDERFLKCHRSYIVNLDFLREYTRGQIIMENGDKIPVSRPRQQEFMEELLHYMKRKEV